MSSQPNNQPETDPRTRLRELLAKNPHSPEIAGLRLEVLRLDAPKSVVQIDSVRADDTAIAVKATIGLPNGARHTSIHAVDVDPDRSWSVQHDEVQAMAVIRALDGLGIRAEQSQPSQRAAPQQEQRQPPVESPSAQAPEARLEKAQPPRQAPPQPEQRAPRVEPPASAAAEPRSDDDHLTEYSWTSFWQAAHARNITREQVEQALGRSIHESTPKAAVDALVANGIWE